jgi:acetyltransferase-like isoleucine patch superfamily enzyme
MGFDERDITGKWDYRTLPTNVRVGTDSWLERRDSFARFRSVKNPGLVLGRRVQVFTWTTFNVEPEGSIEVGDDSVLVGGVFMCAERISIGRRVVVSYYVTIADSDFHPIDSESRVRDAIANSPHSDRKLRPIVESAPISIGDDAWIGVGAIILKGVNIGAGARIEAGAVVTRDVPAGHTITGNPGRDISLT